MKIENYYKDKSGIIYPNVREVIFTKEEMATNLEKYITETSRGEQCNFFEGDDMDFDTDGFYIYQSHYDKNKALRVYKKYAEYKFNGENDEILISKLQDRQSNIKLTKFPTGVLTRENSIFGQEIPFYDDYKTLYHFRENIANVSHLVAIYNKCLQIIEELCQNGVYYTDIHPKNFMVNNNDVKLIDFEYCQIKFDDSSYNNLIFERITFMFNLINSLLGSDVRYNCPVNFEEAYENLDVMKKRLLK